jgi:hypothetical protein
MKKLSGIQRLLWGSENPVDDKLTNVAYMNFSK